MPTSDREDGWIHSNLLQVPARELQPEQVQRFLAYLFASVASKPKPILLREGTAVARYLATQAFAVRSGPSGSRSRSQQLDRLTKMIWGTVFAVAPIEAASHDQAIRFFRRHADTYLAGYDINEIIKNLDSIPPMEGPRLHFRPPNLMSRQMSVSGEGNPHLLDDLSERIYAGYQALRRYGIRNAGGLVADALNLRGITGRSRGTGSTQ